MPRPISRRKHLAPPPAGLAEDERPFVHDQIVRGVKASRVKTLIDRGVLGAKAVHRAISARTFSRRLANGETLKPAEADGIARLLRVTELARKTFGDADLARQWLNLPNPVLRERIPIELAATDAGAREVEGALLHLAHGDYL
jgi:putative toxin-antitoxin system antitoxin component (TIGR02293 family)